MIANGIKLKELAKELDGELVGSGDITVRNVRGIELAEEGDLTFLLKKSLGSLLKKTRASCVIVPSEVKAAPVPIIRCKNANLAFKKAVEVMYPGHIPHPKGIHEKAAVGEKVKIGENVAIGAFSVIEDRAEIGSGSVIYANCYIGSDTKIGEGCIIYPNTTIRERITIGKRVIIHPGCVIGADGFGYERTETCHNKIPHVGDVIIEDDVELGACVMVDRAKIEHTKIGKGTKIDNLVQVAHNVTIGANCIIVAQCGISGSVKIGNNVIVAGQVGIADHVEIGSNAIIAAQSGVMKNVPSNALEWGTPARPMKQTKESLIFIKKLPEIYKRLKALEKKLEKK